MAHVMQQGRGKQHARMLLKLRVFPAQVRQGLAGQMQHAEGMGEAARLRAMKSQIGGAE